jgi:hypothetical protein
VKRLARALLPPLAAFLVAHAFLCLVSATTARPPWRPGSWAGPDSALYLSIARHGYELVPCSPNDPPPGHCGNAGWMPAYPWLMRPLIAVGVPPRWASVLVPAGFCFACLVLLWTGFLSSWRHHGGLALVAAAFFPGQVYQHGAFPLAQLSVLVLVCLSAARRDRWLLAGGAGFAASLTYATGWLLGPVLAAWGLVLRARRRPVRLERVAGAALATMAGFVCLLGLHYWQTGTWNAFFLIQGAYGHRLTNPLVTWWLAVAEVCTAPWQGVREGPHLQTLLVSLWVLSILTSARSRSGDRMTSLLALYTVAFWLFPLSLGSSVSLYRSEATLLPSVLLAETLPRPALVAFAVAMVLVAWPMAVLFFRLLLV